MTTIKRVKRYCKHGHDTDVVGFVYSNKRCRACHLSLGRKFYYARTDYRQQCILRQAAKNANIRAVEWGVIGYLLPEDIKEVRNNPCYYCGGPGYGIDHVIPLSKQGINTKDNLVSCCNLCNATKSDQLPDIWGPVHRNWMYQEQGKYGLLIIGRVSE